MLAIVLAVFGIGPGRVGLAASGDGLLDFSRADFTILKPGTAQVIGHAHYWLEPAGAGDLLHGENRYLDGQHDIETDRIEIPSPGAAPVQTSFEHSFFDRDGSPILVARADFRTGDAACIRYQSASAGTSAAVLDFPPDTYAGAALSIPIEHRLRDDRVDPIRLHAFSCVPGPRVVTIEVSLHYGLRWSHYAGEVVAADVRPRLGWWDVLLMPFIPKIRAWFDPADRFSYLGGEIQRFYRGPWVELVRERATLRSAPSAPQSRSGN